MSFALTQRPQKLSYSTHPVKSTLQQIPHPLTKPRTISAATTYPCSILSDLSTSPTLTIHGRVGFPQHQHQRPHLQPRHQLPPPAPVLSERRHSPLHRHPPFHPQSPTSTPQQRHRSHLHAQELRSRTTSSRRTSHCWHSFRRRCMICAGVWWSGMSCGLGRALGKYGYLGCAGGWRILDNSLSCYLTWEGVDTSARVLCII